MTPVNMTNAVYYSQFPGLGNYMSRDLSFNIPAQSLDGTIIPAQYYEVTQGLFIDNTNAISQVLLQFSGLDNLFYYIRGGKDFLYNGSTRVFALGSAEYSINLDCYYDAGQLKFHIVIAPVVIAVVNIPAITVNIETELFLAPF